MPTLKGNMLARSEATMHGLMMEIPLLIPSILDHAEAVYADQEIVTRTVEGPIHRYSYRDAAVRSKQLATVLGDLGIELGDRVATIAWNTHRHFEVYYGVAGIGAVVHTINPRLHPSQIAYLIEHADDKYVFVDTTFVPLMAKVAEHLKTPCRVIVMTDQEHMPEGSEALCYESLLQDAKPLAQWKTFDERAACAICYTSGTTGNPKGVVYSHRSTVIHALSVSQPSGFPVAESDALLPVVPMFHVNAWGFPYSVPMNGGKLVMPGPRLDGPGVWELLKDERVTMSAGVPTVWQRLLAEMDVRGPLPDLQRVVIGGSAAPDSMIRAFQDKWNVEVWHGWGMTETSPVGSTCRLKPAMREWDANKRVAQQCKQGRAVYGIQMRIVDDDRNPLDHDGKRFGELEVRGPWVRSAYYKEEGDGGEDWFPTGDVATIDQEGYMQITDRKKDLIKSGGEWISSIELENLAMGHPGVEQAAVIGIPHPEWTERPLLLIVAAEGANPTADDVIAHLREKVPKWWLPDRVETVDSLPIGATGKVLKAKLREQFMD